MLAGNRIKLMVGVLAALMLIVPCAASSTSVAEDPPSLHVSDSVAYTGESVDVLFSVNATVLSSALISVLYDDDALKLLSVSEANVGTVVSNACDGGFNAVWMDTSGSGPVMNGTIIMVATFLIKEGTNVTSTSLTVTVDQTYDVDLSPVTLSVSGGSIKIFKMDGDFPALSLTGSKVMQGDDVIVKVKLANVALTGLRMTILYDTDMLTLCEDSVILSPSVPYAIFNHVAEDGRIDLIWANSQDVEMNGDMLMITFRASSTDETVVSHLSVSYDDTYDSDGNYIEMAATGCDVTILGENILMGIPSKEEIVGALNSADEAEFTIDPSGIADMLIGKEIFNSLTEGKKLTVNVISADGNVATWTFEGTNEGPISSGTDMNLDFSMNATPSGSMSSAIEDMSFDGDALFFEFEMAGIPPYVAKLEVYVGDIFEDGTEISLYHLDKGNLVSEGQKVTVVDGKVTLTLTHFSEFAILNITDASNGGVTGLKTWQMAVISAFVIIVALLLLAHFYRKDPRSQE